MPRSLRRAVLVPLLLALLLAYCALLAYSCAVTLRAAFPLIALLALLALRADARFFFNHSHHSALSRPLLESRILVLD